MYSKKKLFPLAVPGQWSCTWSVVMGYFTFLCIHAFEVYVSTVLIMLADSLGSPSSPPAPQTLYHAPPSQATCK